MIYYTYDINDCRISFWKVREGAGGGKTASRASEKHLFLSFNDEGSFDMLRARTDTGIIGLAS